MSFFYCGFNGFNQWETNGDYRCELKLFKVSELCNCTNPDKGIIESFDIHIDWAYNLFILNSQIHIKGFHIDDLNSFQELTNPDGFTATGVASNEDYILFYSDRSSRVWKYYLDGDAEQQWKLLPNFVKVDQRICPDNSDSTFENDDEYISKIVNGARLTIALSTKGRIFNIPYEMNFTCPDKIIDIACGYEHGILLTESGNVYTWGGGSRCQLGHGTMENLIEPELVEALSGIKIAKVSASGWHSCAISESGDLYTWGWNEKGQLGVFNSQNCVQSENAMSTTESLDNSNSDGNESSVDESTKAKLKKVDDDCNSSVLPNYALPMLIDIYDSETGLLLENNVVDVSCGSKHTVLKLDDGTIWGSGCNKYGQLGCDPNLFENFSRFTKLDINVVSGSVVKCGPWATVIMLNQNK